MGTEEKTLDSLENFVFKKEYLDEDGCSYWDQRSDYERRHSISSELEAATNFLHGRILGFCCCGDPYEMLLEICGYLETIEKVNRVDSNFVSYYLDNVRLTEHGGSIRGAWLSEKGKRFVRIVRELEIKMKEAERDILPKRSVICL